MATTAGDIITGGLLLINAYSPSEALNPQDGSVGLAKLNDLLDSLSNQKSFIYTQVLTNFTWINGQYQYSVGNPTGGTFTGTAASGSPVVTVTSVPAGVVASSVPTSASDVTDLQNLFPANTTIVATSATSVTMSANATANSIGLDTFTFTTPGNIKMPRPLRFNSGFTRASGGGGGQASLDYAFSFVSFDKYKEELLKNVQGPWPYLAAYQPTFPLGTVYVYPAPGANYTAFLYSDLILSQFASVSSAYALPQGYTRALKALLALELAPIYGKTPSPLLVGQAREARELLQDLNDSPVKTLAYDSAICRSQTTDAGWIMSGGF